MPVLFPTGKLHVVLCFRSDRFNSCAFQVTDVARRCCLSLQSTLIPLGNAGVGGKWEPGFPKLLPDLLHATGQV